MKISDKPTEISEYFSANDIGNLELLYAKYVTFSFSKHTHTGFTVGVIESGAEKFFYRRANHIAPAGTVIVFNPEEVHTGQGATEQGWVFRVFYIDPSTLNDTLPELPTLPFFSQPVIYDSKLANKLRYLHLVLIGSNSILQRQSVFTVTMAELLKYSESKKISVPLVKEIAAVKLVKDFLNEHYDYNVSLKELSQLSGLSPYHLTRVFHRQVGLPPHAYLEQIRIHHAKQLIRNGASIAEAAYSTGFADQSHFTRHFKKLVGVTPGKYYEAYRLSRLGYKSLPLNTKAATVK
ncbi:MAG: AraC family transcriptional regulator [Acidobacteriota bacterium]|nr:AraC family transcriptional regulator [Blastocatellia bacterium]MDW8412440.1 AraC family transcriptional regulator [Acidobacteriota bacterium]